MAIEQKTVLEIKKLSFLCEDRIILNELCFLMYENEKIYINGENGAGKTTFLKLILGLYKRTRMHFDIFQFEHADIFSRVWYKNRNHIAYIPQSIGNITMPFSTFEVIQSSIHPYKKILHKEKIYEIMNYFDIYTFRNKPFRYLSGGEKQKTMIIRAIMQSPSLLLLDEPFVFLDNKSKDILIHFLNKNMFETHPMSYILITHNTENILDSTWNRKKLKEGNLS